MSFGYEVYIEIPFRKLKELDQNQSDLTNLIALVREIYDEFNISLFKT
jgi:hypothetical protein